MSLEKSGWVKSNYQWLKPLKFLGMQFDGVSFRAATRKGATLLYDKAELVKYVSGALDRRVAVSVLGSYVVYGLTLSGPVESLPCSTLEEARRVRAAMGYSYLKIKMVDPSGFCLNWDVPVPEEHDPGSGNT